MNSLEAAVLVSVTGEPIHWHLPFDRTMVKLADSRPLWNIIWENREQLVGIAHSHPGTGNPWPSWEDITTFSAIEIGLGKRLKWWITSQDVVILITWGGPEDYDYLIQNELVVDCLDNTDLIKSDIIIHNWLEELRNNSYSEREKIK